MRQQKTVAFDAGLREAFVLPFKFSAITHSISGLFFAYKPSYKTDPMCNLETNRYHLRIAYQVLRRRK